MSNDNDEKKKFNYKESLIDALPPEFRPDKDSVRPDWNPATVKIRDIMDHLGVFKGLVEVIPDKKAAAELEKYFDNEIEAHDELLDKLRGYMEDPEYRKKMILALASRNLGTK